MLQRGCANKSLPVTTNCFHRARAQRITVKPGPEKGGAWHACAKHTPTGRQTFVALSPNNLKHSRHSGRQLRQLPYSFRAAALVGSCASALVRAGTLMS